MVPPGAAIDRKRAQLGVDSPISSAGGKIVCAPHNLLICNEDLRLERRPEPPEARAEGGYVSLLFRTFQVCPKDVSGVWRHGGACEIELGGGRSGALGPKGERRS
jgi:hypothetical protein